MKLKHKIEGMQEDLLRLESSLYKARTDIHQTEYLINSTNTRLQHLADAQIKLAKDLAMVLDHLKLEIKDTPAKRIITEK